MSTFKSQQRRLTIRGRAFHFVSYEGHPANPKRGEDAAPAMWYLMVEGRRCPVFPCDADRSEIQLDAALSDWALDNAFGAFEPAPEPRRSKRPARSRANENWWGPH